MHELVDELFDNLNLPCSFCENTYSARDTFREHSKRCLTDLDDLLVITYKPDDEPRSRNRL